LTPPSNIQIMHFWV